MKAGLLRRAGAAMVRKLPPPLVRLAARRVQRGSSVSVVVPVTDENAAFLAECVGALGAQSRRAAEVLLVVLGTSVETRLAVAREASSSWRVRLLELPGASVATGLHHGADQAAGDLMMFCDAGDVVAEGAVAALADALEEAAADVSGATRADLGRVGLADLMVRRSLWESAGVRIPEGPHAEWWTAARLLLSASGTTPQGRSVRVGERRGTGEPFGTMPVLAPFVEEWSSAVDGILDALRDEPEQAGFRRWLLGTEAPRYLEDAERCTAAQWKILSRTTRSLTETAVPGELDAVPAEARVRLWLGAHDERCELERFNAARWLTEGQFPTSVRDGGVYAVLPIDREKVPPECLKLAPSETVLVTRLRRLRWLDETRLELELAAFVRGVPESRASVWLVDGKGDRHPLPADPHLDPEVDVLAGERFVAHAPGGFRVHLDAAALLGGAEAGDRWHVEIELEAAGIVRRDRVRDVDLRGSAGAFPRREVGNLVLTAVPSADDGFELVARPPGSVDPGAGTARHQWSASDVRLERAHLVVKGNGPPGGGARLSLSGPYSTASSDLDMVDGRFEVRLALEHDPWAMGGQPLPPGTYRVHVEHSTGAVQRLEVTAELGARMPEWQISDDYRMRLQRGLDGAVLVTLAPPLAEDEVGPLAQQRLQRWYASDEHRLDPRAVYIQSYAGRSATDSPLAIHHALRRLRPDLTLHWAVADRSVPVPEGGRPVLVRSRDWYRALATCQFVVTNTDMDWWFEKRPGQRLLQTFHGYPSKTMGIASWAAKNFTPLRIERLLRRTSATWDLLLTPTPDMDAHYRREYRYEGEILSAGYPRDDVLVGPDATRIRDETRRRLGVAPGQRAVLYAPTWRDDVATNFRMAPMTTAFDVERAAADLGDDYVILLRGHRFHRKRREVSGARLLDVTDYPEVNDLILAADAAVFDYTSMRFDFALTGRPMVFLVPDLERYTRGVRGFLFDFAGSAPGPLVASTREVVAHLEDLDGLQEAHADDVKTFNDVFNGRQDGHAAERVVEVFFGPEPDVGGGARA